MASAMSPDLRLAGVQLIFQDCLAMRELPQAKSLPSVSGSHGFNQRTVSNGINFAYMMRFL
jgi:hypothetical protein